MWSTYHHYVSKGPIEVGAKIARFVKDIINILQRPELLVFNDI